MILGKNFVPERLDQGFLNELYEDLVQFVVKSVTEKTADLALNESKQFVYINDTESAGRKCANIIY